MDVYPIVHLVRDVFIKIFGSHTVNAHPVLGVLPTFGDPQAERSNSIIFISRKAPMFVQYIYQFAHELCHFMIPGDVCKSYRWFEETLCQMMSWYALKSLYCSRSERTTLLYPGLYAAIPDYVKSVQADRVPIKGRSLSDFIRLNLPHLQAECYDRSMNRAVAYEIYPLFLNTPDLWKIVPSLHTLTDDTSLPDALAGLCRTLDVEKSRCDQFIKSLTE